MRQATLNQGAGLTGFWPGQLLPRQIGMALGLALVGLLAVLYGQSAATHKLDLAASAGRQTAAVLKFDQPKPQAKPPQPSGAASAGGVSATSRPKPNAPVTPNCTPAKANPVPSALDLSGAGLRQLIDGPAYYPVYGNTGQTVYQQIMSCTPVSEQGLPFAATTNYSINWHYSYSVSGDNCVITDAAVGAHINQIYPQWISSPSAEPGYSQRWQAFMANLQVHENGHRDIDLQYAAQILHDLQNLPPTDCAGIAQAADAAGNADLAALNQANGAYDAATNHGAAQGAVIPE